SSMNACCSGCGSAGVPRPSSVTIFLPVTALTGVTHERVAFPSTSTMQAPHWPRPQPNRGPCKPTSSRSTYSSGVCGSSSWLDVFFPFTLSATFIVSLLLPDYLHFRKWTDAHARGHATRHSVL